jgi:ABC-2 type transport system ATP-binding protein
MHALSVKDLRKTYRNSAHALKGVSLDVAEGDFFALLGPNGAGKTTLIGIVSSLINKTAGDVFVFGNDLSKEPEIVKSHIGLVPQEFNCSPFEKVKDVVATQAGFYGLSRKLANTQTEKYLKKLQLWEKRDATARMLSGGMKRRLMIARALVHEPKLLILDEPTAGVDIEIRLSMWELLKEINRSGTTIILTTHYLEEAEQLCRNIAIINHGEIVEHTQMATLLNQLHVETFIVSLQKSFNTTTKLEGYNYKVVDDHTLEIELSNTQSMTRLFEDLSREQVSVFRIRNKRNRLEELFVKLIERQDEGKTHVP